MCLSFVYKIIAILFGAVLLTSCSPVNIYLLVSFAICTFVVIPIRKYWDMTAVMLLVFSVIYTPMAFFSQNSASGAILLAYLIAPVAFYRFGRFLANMFKCDIYRQVLIFVIILMYLTPLIIITIKDIALVGIVNISRVMIVNTNDEGLAATLYGLMASVGIGGISALFVRGQKLWLRLGYIVLSLCSILVVVHLVNRTGLVIFGFCLLVSFIISTRGSIRKLFPALLLIFLLVVLVINTDIISDELIAAYQKREVSSISDASQLGGRSAIWNDALSKLIIHPFGWEASRYAHNLWLDIARVGGWGALLFFLIATVYWCIGCIRLLRMKMSPLIIILITINLALFMSSCVEPVIDGSVLFFSIFMLIWGYTANLTKNQKLIGDANIIYR